MPRRNVRTEEIYCQDYQVSIHRSGSHYPASACGEPVSISIAVRQAVRPEPRTPQGPGTPNTTGKQTHSINKSEKTETAERSSLGAGNWKVVALSLLRRPGVHLSDGKCFTEATLLLPPVHPWTSYSLGFLKGGKVKAPKTRPPDERPIAVATHQRAPASPPSGPSGHRPALPSPSQRAPASPSQRPQRGQTSHHRGAARHSSAPRRR
ncbi:hypothetical protein DPEC_G00222500 [Dallia pectoralis]|uniref:Uncharacterized protein n=1 Tax=Dallia pectoralis TaxID=75939 RepID=A0ACC2FZM4_DALPE|nr:hypothetical protein DPEC_G00222500 [Dallia pectoralis]